MEWERAKNIILIAFIILNAGLATMLLFEDRRYTLSQERISNIHSVLSENNINMYALPPRRFAPMRHLDISGFYYDIPALLEIFFDEPPEQADTVEGHYVFTSENARLEIINGFISFDNSRNLSENNIETISHAAAIEVAEAFIAEHFADFRRDTVFDAFGGEGVWVVFRQEYRGQLIHSNRIEFLVTAAGIEWVDMQFGRVIGYSAEPRMIFAPDEVLLTFMQRMRHEAMETPIFITNIDMVYLQEYAGTGVGSVYPAVPVYRIFILGHDLEFLINAYTNVSINF